MAVLNDVVLVADGGDVTGGYRKHTYTYGKFEVALKEGLEQVEKDRRLADGYVYKPDWEIAPFDVGFVRADVSIDMEVNTSDLEIVIDEALRDAEGDIFFERDISPAGLGEFEPGVDFQVGDIVMIERWGKLFPSPVTGWTMVSSETDGLVGNRVHVSGQLISDAAARQRRNQDLLRQVANDKRQLEKSAMRDRQRTSRALNDQLKYIDGDFKLSLQQYANDQAIDAKQQAVSEAEAHLTSLMGPMDSKLTDMKDSYDEALRVIATKMGGRSSVQSAFANSVWQQSALIQQMNARGLSVQEQSNAFAQFAAIEAALWTNQVKIDAEQDYALQQTARPLGSFANETYPRDEDDWGALTCETGQVKFTSKVGFVPDGRGGSRTLGWEGKVYLLSYLDRPNGSPLGMLKRDVTRQEGYFSVPVSEFSGANRFFGAFAWYKISRFYVD